MTPVDASAPSPETAPARPTEVASSHGSEASLRSLRNPLTWVGFALPASGPVHLAIHDARGRLVRVLVDEVRDAGSHSVRWDGQDQAGRPVASGVYLARLQTRTGQDVRKLTLAR